MPNDASLPPLAPRPILERSARDRWIHDEIAVDFPAIDSIVARMWQAFAGDPGDTDGVVTAEIALSVSQARQGGRVPVDVPVWFVCTRCGGRGEVWDEPCGCCAGQGHRVSTRRLDVAIPPRLVDGDSLVFDVGERQPRTHVRLLVVCR